MSCSSAPASGAPLALSVRMYPPIALSVAQAGKRKQAALRERQLDERRRAQLEQEREQQQERVRLEREARERAEARPVP